MAVMTDDFIEKEKETCESVLENGREGKKSRESTQT